MKSTKKTFIQWLKESNSDLEIFDFGDGEIVLSISGSDGPSITDEGLNTESKLIKWTDLYKIDNYLKSIKDWCETKNFLFPSIIYSEWLKQQ